MSDRKVITSGNGESIQPGLWVEIKRFVDDHDRTNGESLWRLRFKEWPGLAPECIEVDATVLGLKKLQAFIKNAIETVETDGGRITEEQIKAASEADR
jgi:hypothetical protein